MSVDESPEPPSRPTPSEADVQALMRRFPGLDHCMSQTLLWFTEQELQVFLQKYGLLDEKEEENTAE